MNFLDICDDVMINILNLIPDRDKFNLLLTCHQIYNLNDQIWFSDKTYPYVEVSDSKFRFKKIEYMVHTLDIPYGVTLLNMEIGQQINYIPPTVKKIHFYLRSSGNKGKSTRFDKLIDYIGGENINIYKNITHIMFDPRFNRSVEGLIPNGITHLNFGSDFNQSIKNSIPHGVKKIKFGNHFNQPIKGHIPNTVTRLNLGCYNDSLTDYIPNSITHLLKEYLPGVKHFYIKDKSYCVV